MADNSLGILRKKGLEGKVTVILHDSQNKPASNVLVKFFFENSSGREEYSATTDEMGFASAIGRIRISVIINANGHNHHRLYHEQFFLTDDTSKMKAGKWVPFETIIPLTIFEKRKPIVPYRHETFRPLKIPMEPKSWAIHLPSDNLAKPLAVELEKADSGDLLLEWSEEPSENENELLFRVNMRFSGGGGLCALSMGNSNTGMPYPYELPSDGYENNYSFVIKNDKTRNHYSRFAQEGILLAFKREINKGEASSFRYGIITDFRIRLDPKTGLCNLILKYLENPNCNDRNSEFSVD